MAVLVGIAFLAGIITAVSPCVLPVLPILFAGGSTGGRGRPFAIIGGLVLSFTVFTVLGASLLDLLGLPQDLLRDVAITLLFVLAATLLIPPLAHLLERPFYFLTRRQARVDANGFVLGTSLGLVFVPCAGPVLAAVTALSASGQFGGRTFAVTGSYALGAALPMLALAAGAQRLAGAMRLMRAHAVGARRVAGVVLGVTAVAIALGVDQYFTTAVPGYTQSLQDRIERSSVARSELRRLTAAGGADAAVLESGRAPEFRDISLWLNTPGGRPLTIAGLRGKVVLVDFWTYSCINCLRTLPHRKAWDRAYRKDGLVIVGVHTPEFAFERVPANVRSSVERLGVRYPVALDNGYGTWRAYQNEYWPAEYLIDRTGRIRRTHFGEGEYDVTERTIRRLLGERASGPLTRVADRTPEIVTTPESYLGYARLERFAGRGIAPDTLFTYRFPARIGRDQLAYAGEWRVEPARIVAGRHARLRLGFVARKIHLVLGGTGRVQVLVDGKRLPAVRVAGTPRLYTLASFDVPRLSLLELRFAQGVQGYAFTFG
ncbi:MAG: cytochrome c biogenesis protein DipZ [Gaiellaceae bacterium]